MTLINRIKAIGKSGVCSDEDLHIFLPNLPSLKGSELIFTIGWDNADKYIDTEAEYFIKGLHLIEEKYKSFVNYSFGFGSPSPSYPVISRLKLKDPILAEKLIAWVLEHGGNYYINTKRRHKL